MLLQEDLFDRIIMKYMKPMRMESTSMFGRLTLDAFKHDWIEYAAGVSMVAGRVVLHRLAHSLPSLEMALEGMDHFGRP